jgi:hypothetical protein
MQPCLDVAVTVDRVSRVNDPVVTYAFGHRCEHDVALDLGAARVVARDVDGRDLPLEVFEPHGELHALVVPARVIGIEHIAYATARAQIALAQLCVEKQRDAITVNRPTTSRGSWLDRLWRWARSADGRSSKAAPER